MFVRVIRPFPISDDGITQRALKEGMELEIADEVAKGLLAEGFVAEPDDDNEKEPASDAAGAVIIPNDWHDARFYTKRAMAARIANVPAKSLKGSDQVNTIIQAEADRRAKIADAKALLEAEARDAAARQESAGSEQQPPVDAGGTGEAPGGAAADGAGSPQ